MRMGVAKTWYANIWIAGDYDTAVDECRRFALESPCCVTVTPTKYVYTGGLEDGVLVRMINYPKFPVTEEERSSDAEDLAQRLMKRLCQLSYSVEYPNQIIWRSNKDD